MNGSRFRWGLVAAGFIAWLSPHRAGAQAPPPGAEVFFTRGGQHCIAETGAQETVLYGEPGIGNQTSQPRYVWCPAPRMAADAGRIIGGIAIRFNVPEGAQVECYPFIGTSELQLQWGTTLRVSPFQGFTWMTWYEPFGLRTMKDIVTAGLRCRLPPGNSWVVGYYFQMSVP